MFLSRSNKTGTDLDVLVRYPPKIKLFLNLRFKFHFIPFFVKGEFVNYQSSVLFPSSTRALWVGTFFIAGDGRRTKSLNTGFVNPLLEASFVRFGRVARTRLEAPLLSAEDLAPRFRVGNSRLMVIETLPDPVAWLTLSCTTDDTVVVVVGAPSRR